MVIVLFGVAGAGKTTVGRSLARHLGWSFYDGVRFHSPASIEKMWAGISLTDADRAPWIESIRALIQRCVEAPENAVVACSALREAYRQRLQINDSVRFVFLKADFETLKRRLEQRHGHFAGPALLQSQFDTLEPPEQDALVIDATGPPDGIVQRIRKEFGV
ncbi:MAG TPA: gluconokinase [Candidatus Eisenbacteria bacterium]|nr:gluconokinase [Candidatus Eisenbacteria bacterium]